ncbi:hypothetical protein D7B24_004076 [Verticillium nonalfalfae]|uniref:Uncharacterized protein n=1 Tax=Verticillium nonalfalfae TaxID=1051616 RepID=A0A3M9XWH4_9PEZI|nr:uncharacterized protein D7B24_004076 [Verticillium nonalfalfae]RNJ52235.1 hypothetical protein D7B24_004076 [Verticillium nonalfalfae]
MKATTLFSAIFLPALAMAQGEDDKDDKYDTSTTTATVTLTQTIMLAKVVETATWTATRNATITSEIPSATSDIVSVSTTSSAPAQVTSSNENAGQALSVSNMVMAGIAGLAALSLM